MNTIERILTQMKPNRFYKYDNINLIDVPEPSLRSEIYRACELGYLARPYRGVYEITPDGLEHVKELKERSTKRLSRQHINDTPPIAWPV